MTANAIRFARAALLAAALAAPANAEPPQTPLVATFAGTGASGNADGPAASATFASPAGIAAAPNGDVYVADRALSVIRLIHDGRVRTIVGEAAGDPVWRPGGYRDGPGPQALLRHPESIALAPDGSLVIADTWNFCLRRYKDGVVTTIAGAPTRWGDVDGPAEAARFRNPLAIAVDAHGTIYVSDYEDPIRKVAPNGTVSSLAFKPAGIVFGLATAPPDKLFVADESGLLEMQTGGGAPQLHLAPSSGPHEPETTEAGAPLGHPYALAALDEHTVAYSDLYADSIGEAEVTRVTRLAGAPIADPNEAGGFRDGVPSQALFNAPAGIARYARGWLVADMGNHRIRYVPETDERDAIRIGRLDFFDTYITHRRPPLVLIGDSEVWTDTGYAASIAGRLQALRPENDVAPVTLPGQDDPGVVGNWLANYLELDRTATVVYLFDDAGITAHNDIPYATLASGGAWTAKLEGQFAALRAQCGAARLVIADIPIGLEAAPSEAAVVQTIFLSDSTEWEHINAVHALVAAAAQKSGVDYVDLWPAFRALDAAGRGPLYHALDVHLTAAGRAHLARLLAEKLRH